MFIAVESADISKIRVQNLLSFFRCEKPGDNFAILHKSSGHRDTPHKTGTNPGKPGRMVTLD